MKHFYKNLAIILWIISRHLTIAAQDSTYARKVVNTLASENLKGRGYVQNGGALAAGFIGNEFKRMGLKTFGSSYFQSFRTSVNTFPGTMSVKVNNTSLKPGIDYLVDAESPSGNGTYSTVFIRADELLKEDVLGAKIKSAKDKMIVIEAPDKSKFSKEDYNKIEDIVSLLKYYPENPAAGIISLTKDKLTWDVSKVQYSKPCITIKVDSLSPLIESVTLNIESKLINDFEGKNVIGYVQGKHSDSLIVLTAHYDHLGMMGDKTIFPGANDNASGTAMLLSLADYYSKHQPEYNIVFIAFAAEELRLKGSTFFTEHPLFELKKIKFLLNFDLAGTGDEGIQVVNGSVFKNRFDQLSKINNTQHFLSQVKIRGEACNSDHCPFYNKKVPCFFIYTLGGIAAYHDIYDRAETLPLSRFDNYFKLMVAFIKEL
jgi:hypothetical protein